MRRTRGLTAAVVVGLLLIFTAACASAPDNPGGAKIRRSEDPSGYRGAALTDPYTMPDKTFTDTAGQSYNLRTTPSRPVTLLFFGYTNCSDICIGVMSDVAITLSRMDQSVRDQIQVVFITSDPRRDDPKTIRKYLDRFDPSFVGLTGDLSTIKAVAGRVGVDIEGEQKLPSGGYEIGHSAQVIGFGKDEKAMVLWTPGTPVADLMHDFELLAARQQ